MSNDSPPPGAPAPQDPPPPGAGSQRPYESPQPYGSPQQPYGSPQQPHRSEQPEAVARPKLVDVAFWLYIAAAALSLLGLIVSLASMGALREQALRELEEQGQTVPPEAVEGAIWAAFAIGVIFALVFTAGYVILAVFMRRGFGWTRIVLAVLAALAIFGVVGGFGIGALQFLCLAAATVLVFLPQSNAWFTAAARHRAAGRA